jgi:hypothetical protein
MLATVLSRDTVLTTCQPYIRGFVFVSLVRRTVCELIFNVRQRERPVGGESAAPVAPQLVVSMPWL